MTRWNFVPCAQTFWEGQIVIESTCRLTFNALDVIVDSSIQADLRIPSKDIPAFPYFEAASTAGEALEMVLLFPYVHHATLHGIAGPLYSVSELRNYRSCLNGNGLGYSNWELPRLAEKCAVTLGLSSMFGNAAAPFTLDRPDPLETLLSCPECLLVEFWLGSVLASVRSEPSTISMSTALLMLAPIMPDAFTEPLRYADASCKSKDPDAELTRRDSYLPSNIALGWEFEVLGATLSTLDLGVAAGMPLALEVRVSEIWDYWLRHGPPNGLLKYPGPDLWSEGGVASWMATCDGPREPLSAKALVAIERGGLSILGDFVWGGMASARLVLRRCWDPIGTTTATMLPSEVQINKDLQTFLRWSQPVSPEVATVKPKHKRDKLERLALRCGSGKWSSLDVNWVIESYPILLRANGTRERIVWPTIGCKSEDFFREVLPQGSDTLWLQRRDWGDDGVMFK